MRGAAAVLSLAITVAGCGLTLDVDPPDVDAGQPPFDAEVFDAARDAALPDADLPDAPPPIDPCEGLEDGDVCGPEDGPRLICLDAACVPSVCGDDFHDAEVEECDDGNELGADGCEPGSCSFSCHGDGDCDDDDPCDGVESCDGGSCAAGDLPKAEMLCVAESGASGACDGGICRPFSCGDGIVTTGEECDDENTVAGDGCEPDCQRTCDTNADCDDGDVCTGVETCGEDGCQRVSTAVCEAPDACSVARCDPLAGCMIRPIDDDGDGHAPITGTSADCGADCNDHDPSVWVGAPEQCNVIDDDCDGTVDEDVRTVTCRPDADGDGFGGAATMESCRCPDGWITGAGGDCFDRGDPIAALVFPLQREFFADPWCGADGDCAFDYDCDGAETRRWSQLARRCTYSLLTLSCSGSGWTAGVVPTCGGSATWTECTPGIGPTGTLLCEETRSTRRQQCR